MQSLYTANFICDVFQKFSKNPNARALNTIRTGGGGGGGGCFPPVSRFFANNFGSNKGTHSKLGDLS